MRRINSPERTSLLLLAYCSVILVSLFGNLLVCHVVVRTKRLHNSINTFLANLALSDLLITVLNIPFNLVRFLLNDWPFGQVMCSVIPFIQVSSVYASTFTMVAIAVDRYKVTEVFTYKRLIRCQTEFPSPSLDFRKWLTLATFLTQYLVPLLLTFVVYTFVSKRIWWRIKIGSSTQNQLIFHLETKKRTVKMLVYVVVLFAVCWLPLNMYHLIIEFSSYVGPMRHSTTTYYLCHWLAMSNVCYNPFIYCWLNDHFRSGAKSCVVLILKKVFCFNININSHVNSNKGVVRYTSSVYKDSSTASSSSAPARSGITQRNIQDLETRNPTSKENCDLTNMSNDAIQLEEINVNKRRASPRKTKALYNTATAPGVEQWHEIKNSNDNELLYKFSTKYSVNFHSILYKI
ncbi:putative G-protein coupled receptor 83, partial [Armadillidium nasatum]